MVPLTAIQGQQPSYLLLDLIDSEIRDGCLNQNPICRRAVQKMVRSSCEEGCLRNTAGHSCDDLASFISLVWLLERCIRLVTGNKYDFVVEVHQSVRMN